MTMKVVAVHSIHTGAGKKPHAPGTVFELEDRDARELVARKAVRRPTEDELKAYDAAKAEKAEAAKPAGDGKGQGTPQK